MSPDDDVVPQSIEELVQIQLDLGNASKRAREVAGLILANGSCTTSDIEALGYKHSPRAIGDLRDAGIHVCKSMESYTDPDTGTAKRRARYAIDSIVVGRQSRRQFTKAVADQVKSPGRCAICGGPPPLQVDHRVPFEIGGESYPHRVEELMPLCASCNRAKSWQCENCANWFARDVLLCETCFWASPEKYDHVALQKIREIRIVLTDESDIQRFDSLSPDTKAVIIDYLKQMDSKS